MADKPQDPIVPVNFDEPAITDDLAHLPDDADTQLRDMRRQIDRDGGIRHSRLKACEGEGRDGTRLPGCVKTYVPWPDGRWGVVFTAVEHPTRPWGLRAIAYGVRHHPRGSNALTVYDIADKRLNTADQSETTAGERG